MPALMVAEAARESDDERGEDEPGGPWRGSGLTVETRAWRGEPEDDREGGRELRSGILFKVTQLEQKDNGQVM